MLDERMDDTITEDDTQFLVALASEDEESVDQNQKDEEPSQNLAESEESGEAEADNENSRESHLQRIAELEERLRLAEEERAARERELLCLNLLRGAELPAELSAAVMASDDMEKTVELIRSTVTAAVEAEIVRRCRSDTPAVGSRAPMTKEELMRTPVAELQRMRDMGAVFG